MKNTTEVRNSATIEQELVELEDRRPEIAAQTQAAGATFEAVRRDVIRGKADNSALITAKSASDAWTSTLQELDLNLAALRAKGVETRAGKSNGVRGWKIARKETT